MRFYCILLSLFLFGFGSLTGQISHGGSPLPFNTLRCSDSHLFEEMPTFDLKEQLRMDSLEYGGLRTSNRFAYKFVTDFTPNNSGIRYTLADGTKIWRLGIRSNDAISINLLFTEYELPEGAQLFVYNVTQSQVRGSFNHLNNSEKGILPVSPVYGDAIIIEYQEPAKASFHGRLRIGEVNHAYRSFGRTAEPGSEPLIGSCIPPLACSVAKGDPYEMIGKSVVLLIIDGQYLCTGTLLNNTNNDGTPFLLTASHCLNNNFQLRNPDYEEIAGTVIAFFNYDSPTCESPMRGSEEMSLASSYLRAVNEDVDLALLELYDIPPVYYQPYYAGWNAGRSNVAPYVCIQHPIGSTKRFSLTEQIEVNSFDNNQHAFNKNSFWRVPTWEIGCTAGGSSGSALFDDQNHVVGALSGGASYCDTPHNDFFYGLFAAWQPDEDPDKQLKSWLARDKSDRLTCDGMNPYAGMAAVRLSNVADSRKQDQIEATLLTQDSYLFGLNETKATEYAEKYALLSPAFVYGCYLVTPAISGRAYPEVEICLYSGTDRPETLLAQKQFRPVYQAWDDEEFDKFDKPLYRSQEHFIAFDKPVKVEQSLFISYRILGENDTRFCVYNIKEGEISSNSAWINLPDEGWIEASQHPKKAFSTSLFIDPVLTYSDSETANEQIAVESPVKVIAQSSAHTLHILLSGHESSAEFSLLHLSGKLIDRQSIRNTQTELSYPQQPDGFYIARISYQGKEYSYKLRF